ncbi:MAG: DUF4292 domain-containing protein [Bacteroidia bacterium]|nr:DUF4292 domain-containing protein [Bacteroidia bacterium]
MKSRVFFVGCTILATLYIFSGCKSGKNIQKKSSYSQKQPFNKNELVHNNVIYKTFLIKGKAEYSDEKTKQQFQYKIQGYRDSLLWASLTVMGFEGMRMKISQDSIWILNRLKKQVMVGSYQDIEKLGGLPVKLDWAQELLVGNTPDFVLDATFEQNSNKAVWKEGSNEFILILDPNNQKLVSLTNKQPKRTTSISYAQFSEVIPILPASMLLKTAGKSEQNVALHHQKVEFDVAGGLNCSFNVPHDYIYVPIQ